MSFGKPLALAAAFVVALSSLASAATTRHHRQAQAPVAYTYSDPLYSPYFPDDANTRAAEQFQEQFKNTY